MHTVQDQLTACWPNHCGVQVNHSGSLQYRSSDQTSKQKDNESWQWTTQFEKLMNYFNKLKHILYSCFFLFLCVVDNTPYSDVINNYVH